MVTGKTEVEHNSSYESRKNVVTCQSRIVKQNGGANFPRHPMFWMPGIYLDTR